MPKYLDYVTTWLHVIALCVFVCVFKCRLFVSWVFPLKMQEPSVNITNCDIF